MSLYRVPAHTYGGFMPGPPLIGVVHSAETPLRAGYALSIARNWFASSRCPTSAHEMVDPRDVVVMVPDDRIAYHCGTGNRRSKGYEQAGYARFSRAEWTTPDGLAQLDLLAARIAADAVQYGWPLRWATHDQIRAAHAGGPAAGLATHDDMRRAIGGTTHHDPMPNYPKDLLLAAVKRHARSATSEEDDMTTEQMDELIGRLLERHVPDPSGGKPLRVYYLMHKSYDYATQAAHNSAAAARDAAVARALAEEHARAGRALTDDEIQRIADRVAAEVDEAQAADVAAHLTVTTKES